MGFFDNTMNNTVAQGVTEHTGFPNPATDSYINALDITDQLVRHPAATFFMNVSGSNWENMGIFAGDIAIIDRALQPKKTDTIIYWEPNIEGFMMKKFSHVSRDASVWGVVTNIIHKMRP